MRARDHSVREVSRRGLTSQVHRLGSVGHNLKHRVVDSDARTVRLFVIGEVLQKRPCRKNHRHGIREVLAKEPWGRTMRSLRHHDLDPELLVECQEKRLGAGDGTKKLQDEIAQNISVAV